MKTSLTLGVLAVVALLVSGIVYWNSTRARSLLLRRVRLAHLHLRPVLRPQRLHLRPVLRLQHLHLRLVLRLQRLHLRPVLRLQPLHLRQVLRPQHPAPQASASPPAPAPRPAPSSTPPVIAQSNQPAASPGTPPSPPATAERAQATGAPSATPAAPATLPADGQMSGADRRQVQEILQRLNYYQGPIDGKFGQATRAAIRLFQDSIKVKSTGYLTAAEATRLKGSAPR